MSLENIPLQIKGLYDRVVINKAILFVYFIVFSVIITLWINIGTNFLNRYFDLKRNPWITFAIAVAITLSFVFFLHYSGISIAKFE